MKKYDFAKLTFLIIVLTGAAIGLFRISYDPRFTTFIERFGVWGVVIVTFYIILSHIFAPISGTPVVAASAVFFGIPSTLVIVYIAGLISSAVNFFISRKFGRVAVTKFIGERSMEKVDQFVGKVGIKMLVFSRLFGFTFFELISYAAGLTSMRFRDYIIVTILFTGIPSIVIAFVFERIKTDYTMLGILFFAILIIVGLFFSLATRYIWKRRKGQR